MKLQVNLLYNASFTYEVFDDFASIHISTVVIRHFFDIPRCQLHPYVPSREDLAAEHY